jgi:hypothetical protein
MKVTDVLEDSRNIWMVSHVLDLAGLPPHVRIVDERAPTRSLTVAVWALLDKRLYHRLESAAAPMAPPTSEASGPEGVMVERTSGDPDPEYPDPRGTGRGAER